MKPVQRFNHERSISSPSRPAVAITCAVCGRVAVRRFLMRRVIRHIERIGGPVRITLTAKCADCHSVLRTRVRVGLDRRIKFDQIQTELVSIGSRRT